MKTRMTELFGIKYPIMLAGMNWLTTPKLVAAVSNAGGLGVLAGNHQTPDELRAAIQEIRSLTDKPFGVNLTLGIGSAQRAPIVIEEKVPVLNYALGRPPEIAPLIEAVHGYGGKVIGTIALLRHALRSEQLGADALIITGYEAASHSGNVGALVLVPTITEAVKVPCIGAGGYADGHGLAAALALGAEGISMGSRLAATQDAEVTDAVKETWVNASEEDTVIDPAFDGINCRVLRNKAAEDLLEKKAFPLFDAISAGMHMKKVMNMSWGELFRTANNLRKQQTGIGGGQRGLGSSMRFAVGSRLFRTALEDPVNGILMMGQTAGRIKDIPTVADIIERTVKEAEEIQKTMTKQFAN
ncbi:MAG: nitronate monooxygenase [Dehalococcoidales bacterium]|nr:MAG: nitronate monooxygenase [Dehalococcoidales bacterium]